LLASPIVVAVAKRHGVTPEQAFLRALTQIGISPLTGTASEQHMRDDLGLFELELLPSEQASIVALFAG
jgi:diketogulonate reductase-like aldo/keto reductase